MSGKLARVFKQIYRDAREAIAIESVSAFPELRPEIRKMGEWTKLELEALGATCTLEHLGMQTLPNGEEIELGPTLLATLGSDPNKKTVMVYGHLDVMPAVLEDGWDSEPFILTERGGKLYGRGATDDKGPVSAWINCLEAMQKAEMDIPVNLKFILEGMEEAFSTGLEGLLKNKRNTFMKGVDYVCVSDNYWLGTSKPCLTYGLRGIIYFHVEIECDKKDLHSGIYGGAVYEGMRDLVTILDSLTDTKGNILISGVTDGIADWTEEEQEQYRKIDFSVDDFKSESGLHGLPYEGKIQLL